MEASFGGSYLQEESSHDRFQLGEKQSMEELSYQEGKEAASSEVGMVKEPLSEDVKVKEESIVEPLLKDVKEELLWVDVGLEEQAPLHWVKEGIIGKEDPQFEFVEERRVPGSANKKDDANTSGIKNEKINPRLEWNQESLKIIPEIRSVPVDDIVKDHRIYRIFLLDSLMAPKKFVTMGKRRPGVPAPLPQEQPPSPPGVSPPASPVPAASPPATTQPPATTPPLPLQPLPQEDALDDVVGQDEDEASIPLSPGQSPPYEPEKTEEAEAEEQQPSSKRRRKEPQQAKKKNLGWSLPDEQEQELVEWLQANTYLWLRSTKDYHRKKAAWEQKAQELNISLKHLQNWWKNVKDWFVKLSKKTSGQATRVLTDRDQWILKNIAFYNRTMTTDVPDTLGSLARDRSLSAPAGSADSASPVAGPSTSSQPDLGDNVLEYIEIQAAASKETGTTTRWRRKTSAEVCKEDEWMAKLQENIEANNRLLQQVMQKRAQPVTQKSAFLNYFVKYMQAAPDHHFLELQLLLYDRIGRQVSQFARTSAPAAAAPQPQPPLPPPPPIMLSPGKQTSSTVPQSTVPQSTVPQSTVPQSTVPQSTVPQSTVPQSTVATATATAAALHSSADSVEGDL